jgi:hypothetical protein
MKMFARYCAVAALLFASPALAQWQVPDHAVPIGNGAGVTGFNSAAPGTTGFPFVSNGASSDPTFQQVPQAGIANGAVGNAQLANMAPQSIKCNNTASTAITLDCNTGQVNALLSTVSSPTGSTNPTSGNCGQMIVMTGGFNTITLPAANSVPSGCRMGVKNDEAYTGIGTGRGKKLANFPTDFMPSGGTILWPKQAGEVVSDGTNWKTSVSPGRWLIPQDAELCYRKDGSATSDGLGDGSVASGCLSTIQAAVTTIGEQWDGGGYHACNIGAYAGGANTITESVSQTGQSVGCYLTLNMRAGLVWTTAGSCWTNGDNGITIFNFNLGFTPTLKCNSGNAASTGQFYGHQSVIYDINGSFEWDPQGTNDDLLVLDAQGRATLALNTMVVGPGTAVSGHSILNCMSHCSGAQISGLVAFSPSVTLGQAYIAHTQSYILTTATYSGSPTVTNATSPTGLSILITNGTSIPGGSSAGSNGGVVCTSQASC